MTGLAASTADSPAHSAAPDTAQPVTPPDPRGPGHSGQPAEPATVDVGALERELRTSVEGEIRFDAGSRALYATDASNYRQVPIGVVLPRSIEALVAAVRVCRDHGAPVTLRGGGTSLAGQTCNTAVIIDSSKYCNRLVELDPERRLATVEPGLVLDDLRNAAKRHGLTFGPDPSTHDHNTLGGMIGNNSAGVHSVMAGKTVENVETLEVLTYDGLRLTVGATPEDELGRIIATGGRRGQIYRRLRDLRDRYADEIRARFPDIPRRVSGYNLDQLLPEHGFNVARALVGSEGTCVTVLSATLRLVPWPAHRVLLVVSFDDVCHAADRVAEIRRHGPIGIEGIDELLVQDMHEKHLRDRDVALLPEGGAWLLVEFGGDSAEDARGKAERLQHDLDGQPHVRHMRVYEDSDAQERLWKVREAGLGATAWVPDDARDTWPGWEDSAVGVNEVGAYLRDLLGLYDKYGYHAAVYGHFGDGLIHTRIDFGLHTQEDVDRFRHFLREAAELVVRHGGSLSGEHGDGQARAELLPVMFGERLVEAFREFRQIWDPAERMNPHKLVHSRPLDANLRLGPRFHPPKLDSHFKYPGDRGSFAHAALRCVGVCKCRRHAGMPGTMCPSYRATREEKHSTRGRARMLQEMLQGDPIGDGWRSEEVHEALDLCLACKGCKGDCPVGTDMATYKAEFLSHYYDGRLRPRTAYSMGLIHRWARMIAAVPWVLPGLVNAALRTPGLGALARLAAGIAQDRPVPAFAGRTFRQSWRRPRRRKSAGAPRVVLWTDSFNNHFDPGALRAAAAVLADAGCAVEIPRRNLCCGRPYYDYGFLDAARKMLRDVLDGMKEPLDAGAWVVGLEPSCLATFREELINFFPDDPQARRLRDRSLLLSDFVVEITDYHPPPLDGRAMVHTHCHHKAVFHQAGERELLQCCGLEFELLDVGCCGMAGSFGYETHKYPVSLTIGEQGLLPRVRAAEADTLILADGFSCREQIRQTTERRARTLPGALADAIARRDRPAGAPGRLP